MSHQTKTAAEAGRDIAKERLIKRGAVGARAEHASGQQSCGYFEGAAGACLMRSGGAQLHRVVGRIDDAAHTNAPRGSNERRDYRGLTSSSHDCCSKVASFSSEMPS